MDFWFGIGMSVVLQVVGDSKARIKVYPALAKLYVAIQRVAKSDTTLADLIEDKGGSV